MDQARKAVKFCFIGVSQFIVTYLCTMKKNASTSPTYESLRPLTLILRIFALNGNVADEPISPALHISKMLFTMAVMGLLDTFCMYYKITYMYPDLSSSIKLTDFIQMVYDHIQYIVDLWFIYKFRGHFTMGYFKKYEHIDHIFGITDCTTIKKKLVKLLCFFTSIWLISSAFDFVAWYQGYGFMLPLVCSISYFYLFLKMMTILDLISHVMHIEIRLTLIADFVQHYYSVCAENWNGMEEGSTCKTDSTLSILDLKDRLQPLNVVSKNEYNEVLWLTRCYLLLTEQVEFINSMFGFRILLNSLSLLIDIIRFTNISVRLILGTQMLTYGDKYMPAVSSLVRMLTCVAMLISLVLHCENTYDQKDKIVSIIDQILVNKDPNEKLRAALIELRALVLTRPITFNMAKFFRLDFQFLMSIASITVTYTIILLQSMN